MCDYSLHSVASRPARVGDRLTTRDFGTGTRGFSAADNTRIAICILPGTELAFAKPVECAPRRMFDWAGKRLNEQTAIFRQVNKERAAAHHDALEFPDGQIILLTSLVEGQEAVVLQLPARPLTASEAESQKRAAYVG
jgi:hypothetical protein